MKAKNASLAAKIVAGVVLIAGHALLWIGKLPNADSKSICACAFSIMGIFGTIDLNLVFDKFTSQKGNGCVE